MENISSVRSESPVVICSKRQRTNTVLLGEHLLCLTPGRKVKKLYFWLLMTFFGYRCSLFSGWPSHTVRGRNSPAPQHLDHGQHLKNTAALISAYLFILLSKVKHIQLLRTSLNLQQMFKPTSVLLRSTLNSFSFCCKCIPQ